MAEPTLLAETTSLLRDIVAFDTTSRNSNLPLIAYLADYLSDRGASTRLIPSADGTKANRYEGFYSLFAGDGAPFRRHGPGTADPFRILL